MFRKWSCNAHDEINVARLDVYECTDCSACPCKDKCTRAKGNKRLYVSKNYINHIMSETGIMYRMNRSIQVEGAFGGPEKQL